MPRDTTTYDLREVAGDLEDDLDGLADDVQALTTELDNLDEDDDAEAVASTQTERAQLLERGQRLENRLAGVQWAIGEWAPDADSGPEVTLGGLTAGEYAHVRDKVDELKQTLVGASGETDADGARRIAFVAAGVVDGPFLDSGTPQGIPGFDQRRETVAGELIAPFVAWLYAEIDDLSTPDVSAGNFGERLAATETSATSNSPERS